MQRCGLCGRGQNFRVRQPVNLAVIVPAATFNDLLKARGKDNGAKSIILPLNETRHWSIIKLFTEKPVKNSYQAVAFQRGKGMFRQLGTEVKAIKTNLPVNWYWSLAVRVTVLALVLYAFFVSIDLMAASFKLLGSATVSQIIQATSNPFVGLFIGLLATAILQSSSTTTAMIVAIVASGGLSFQNAVPLVMGANIGTTITSTIVSMGHITRRREFRKAFAVASAHSIFNIVVAAILFPVEYYTGVVSGGAIQLTSWINNTGLGGIYNGANFLKMAVQPVVSLLLGLLQNPVMAILASLLLLFAILKTMTSYIKSILVSGSLKKFDAYFFSGSLKSLALGGLFTAALQSSSLAISLVVPLVATGKTNLHKAFPYILGANLGTTITALLAALSRSEAALAIAFVHVFFNLSGVLIFYPAKALRELPVKMATRLGNLAERYRLVGFAYVLLLFFVLPFILIYSGKGTSPHKSPPAAVEHRTEK